MRLKGILVFVVLSLTAAAQASGDVVVTLNHSGQYGQVLQNTLVELTVCTNENWDGVDVEAAFTLPSGQVKVLSCRQVLRPGFSHSYVARIAATEAGQWTWQATSSNTAEPLESGGFTVYAMEGAILPPSERQQPDFHFLYDNDPTITTGTPYFGGQDIGHLGRRVLRSVADVASVNGEKAVDVQIFTASFTWVPFWQSDFYPTDKHLEWFYELHADKNFSPERITEYVGAGNDLVETFIGATRHFNQIPFISFRINDHHYLDTAGGNEVGISARHLSQFYMEHPEYRVGPPGESWRDRLVLNWAIPEVRAHSLSFIHELATKYDFEGLHLDFMRHYTLFSDATSEPERIAIITDFIEQVRLLLNATAPEGTHRWLAVRIPLVEATHRQMGIDLGAIAEAGVDMFILSSSYYSMIQGDFVAINQAHPYTATYLEIHWTTSGPINRTDLGWGSIRQQTRDEQFYTAANLAYARGLKGISLFNFGLLHGLRSDVKSGYEDTSVIPFHILPSLADPARVAQKPPHYFIARLPSASHRVGNVGLSSQATLNPGQSYSTVIDMVEPEGGWKSAMKLRYHVTHLDSSSQWKILFNGTELTALDDVSPPYPTPHPEGFGLPEEYLAWRIPSDLLQDGDNEIEIRLLQGPQAQINYLEVAAYCPFDSGEGTPENPYRISTLDQLRRVNIDLQACYVLANDIEFLFDPAKDTVAVIAPHEGGSLNDYQGMPFVGVFDGDGFAIKNLTLDGGGNNFLALFGAIGVGGQVLNLTLENAEVSGARNVASLAGQTAGTISNCTVEATIQATGRFAAGLVGDSNGQILDSHSSGSVTSSDLAVGGLVGRLSSGGLISGSSSQSGLLCTNPEFIWAGGLVGICETDTTTIIDSHATGNVVCTGQAGRHVGGLVGRATNTVNITNCYATGNITAPGGYAGGLVGSFSVDAGTISNSHAAGNITESGSYSGGLIGFSVGNITDSFATGSVTNTVGSGLLYFGGLIGRAGGDSISNCYAEGDVSGDVRWIGGLIGRVVGPNVENCYATGNVTTGFRDAGGLVGVVDQGSVVNSYATGTVAAVGRDIGGLVGALRSGASIHRSYATGDVSTGGDFIGASGLVGDNHGDIYNSYATGHITVIANAYSGGLAGHNRNTASITNSYSTGSVTVGGTGIGGLVAINAGSITHSFWDIETSGLTESAGGEGVTGVTTAQMMTAATFTGWDFVNVWFNCEGFSYPRLTWQEFAEADINLDGAVNLTDLKLLAEYWLQGASGLCVDIDGDGLVDLADFATLASDWSSE